MVETDYPRYHIIVIDHLLKQIMHETCVRDVYKRIGNKGVFKSWIKASILKDVLEQYLTATNLCLFIMALDAYHELWLANMIELK